MRRFMAVVVFVMLVPFLTGCFASTSKNTVTDGDRALAHQNEEAAKRIQADATVPDKAKAAAKDIELNSAKQKENWGPPKDPARLQPYSPETSDEERKKSEAEHKKQATTFGGMAFAIGAGLTLLGAALRSGSLGAIPFVGPIISKISPRLGNGAAKNEAVLVSLQVAVDQGRDWLDKIQGYAIDKIQKSGLPDGLKQELSAAIPSGDGLKEIIRKVMADKGLLDANSRIYDKNDTGVV